MEQQEKDSPSLKDDLLSSLRNPKSRTARILLVDDEQDITRIMARSLQINGFEVKAFNNPTEALSHFEPESCDLAILDIWMPGMNGFELYRELTKKGNVKVVLMSSFEMSPKEMEKLMPSIRVDAILKKPVKIQDLATVINRVLGV